jgi:hypothetical protein
MPEPPISTQNTAVRDATTDAVTPDEENTRDVDERPQSPPLLSTCHTLASPKADNVVAADAVEDK